MCYSSTISKTKNMNYLDELNAPQKKAVLHQKGPLLIVAGAGAGKTRTVIYRIFHLIKSGINPTNILAVTFTNKAAGEMKERIAELMKTHSLGETPFSIHEKPFIGTFHSLGVFILRRHGNVLGIKRHFSILDKSASSSLIKEALLSTGNDPKQYEPKKIQGIISRNKGELVSVEEYLETTEGAFFSEIVGSVWRRYEELLIREGALDFDDLLGKTVALLRRHKDILTHYQKKWHYIHIDEYQDTNRAQYMMSKLLTGDAHNICAVGDADQNIYSWRGANIKNILRFEKDYPKTLIIFLEQNYRSTATIIKAAGEVIEKNTLRQDKKLFTKNPQGEKIALYQALDEGQEAFFVASKAQELIAGGIHPDQIAVLYRANFQSRALEEMFLTLDIPYQVLGTRFFERKEVKDVLAFIHAAINPDSLNNIKRIINVPPRGIGKVTLAKLFSGMRGSLPSSMERKVKLFYTLLEEIAEVVREIKPSALIKFVVRKTGIDSVLKKEGIEGEERLENIKELVSLAVRYDDMPLNIGLEKLLEDAALASDQDTLTHEQNKEKKAGVKLMTVHASKGLEFPYVFITGLEQGLFPHESSVLGAGSAEIDRSEEERRLFYVALTRAEKKAFLTMAGSRMVFGSREANEPSEFLSDISEDLLEECALVHDEDDDSFEKTTIS